MPLQIVCKWANVRSNPIRIRMIDNIKEMPHNDFTTIRNSEYHEYVLFTTGLFPFDYCFSLRFSSINTLLLIISLFSCKKKLQLRDMTMIFCRMQSMSLHVSFWFPFASINGGCWDPLIYAQWHSIDQIQFKCFCVQPTDIRYILSKWH